MSTDDSNQNKKCIIQKNDDDTNNESLRPHENKETFDARNDDCMIYSTKDSSSLSKERDDSGSTISITNNDNSDSYPIHTHHNRNNSSISSILLLDSIDIEQHKNTNNNDDSSHTCNDDVMVEYIECVLPLHYEMKKKNNNHNNNHNNSDECSIVTTSTVTTLTSTTTTTTTTPPMNDCCCTNEKKLLLTPSLHPKDWPQYPLLLRPTPGSGTHVLGVRYMNTQEYLWEPSSSGGTTTIWQQQTRCRSCQECSGLPMNNGNEDPGKALVIDFESNLFRGTLLVRIRHCSHPITNEPYDDSYGYFTNYNRQYQAVIRGTFKRSLPVSQCVTGNIWKKPLDKLPSPWILNAALKLAKLFAPQSHLSLTTTQKSTKNANSFPYTLSPLGSTPQVITKSTTCTPMDGMHEEPERDSDYTILPPTTKNKSSTKVTSSTVRSKRRKRSVDQWVVQKDVTQKFETNVVYTFEFLQHLINFHSHEFDAGTPFLRPFYLTPSLNGQPLQIMAAHHHPPGQKMDPSSSILDDTSPIWSFDIFHESLIPAAQSHDRNNK